MQGLSANFFYDPPYLRLFDPAVPFLSTINLISNYRMVYAGEVDPYLMSPPCLQGQLQKGELVEPAQYLKVGDCCLPPLRSEERRVGKECRSRWSPHH